MALSRRFYDSLPFVVKSFDQGNGLLIEHFCDQGIQFALDYLFEALEELGYYYDPQEAIAMLHAPIGGEYASSNLDWLGNFVGLHKLNGHYLGVGINPDWAIAQKQYAILHAFEYWQSKGTEVGIRKGTRIWTGWSGAEDTGRLRLIDPTGTGYLQLGDLRWRYDTPLGAKPLKGFFEHPRLGSGDVAPRRMVIHQDRISQRGVPQLSSSRLGSKNTWMVFEFNESQLDEWNTVFPEQVTLNQELFSVETIPTVFAWALIEETIQVNWENEPALHDTRQWIVKIRTNKRIYRIPVFSLYWLDGATRKHFSQITDVEGESVGQLIAEFAFIPEPDDTQINNFSIDLEGGDRLLIKSFSPGLQVDHRMVVGFKLILDAQWENVPFTDKAVRMEFEPTPFSAFRIFNFPVKLKTDGYEVTWDQTQGATCLLSPVNANDISVTRPNVNSDPYRLRATVNKRFRNGQIATRQKEFVFYTTPASFVDSVSADCAVVYDIVIPRFTHFFLPLPETPSAQYFTTGDRAEISFEIEGGFDLPYIVNHEWQLSLDGQWVASPLIANTPNQSYFVYTNNLSRIICHFNNSGLIYKKTTEPQQIPAIALAQDSPKIEAGCQGVGGSLQGVDYTSSMAEDNLVIASSAGLGGGLLTTLFYESLFTEDSLEITSSCQAARETLQEFDIISGAV